MVVARAAQEAREPAAVAPMRLGAPLAPSTFAALRRRAIFECCKWDPQVEDVSTIAPFPLWLSRATWAHVSDLAARLHDETIAMERALVGAPSHVLDELALPRAVRRALAARSWFRRPQAPLSADGPRVMRFDFHLAADGWRISEVNCDVPGGYVEASGVTALFAEQLGADVTGDPAGALVQALARFGDVGLVHATGYADDRQVMEYLRRRFNALGVSAQPCAPDALEIRDRHAFLDGRRLGALLRFFPAEWLAHIRPRATARAFFRGLDTPATNPGACLVVQSKRLPLVWSALTRAPAPTWRALLPETRAAGASALDEELEESWVLKPALGRVGSDILLAGATSNKDRTKIIKDARRHPRHWIVQRRFHTLPLTNELGSFYPCIGVFTLDGRAVGAYGRIAKTPLIDHRAQDIAVLLENAS